MSDYIKYLREKIGHTKIFVPGAACIIVNDRGMILMQERVNRENWGCPGGLMELEETVLETLKREVLEETGLSIKEPTLLGIYTGSRYEGTYPNGDVTQSVLMVFFTNNFSGQLKSDKESMSLKFFPLNNLPQPINKHHSEYINHYKEYIENKRRLPIFF